MNGGARNLFALWVAVATAASFVGCIDADAADDDVAANDAFHDTSGDTDGDASTSLDSLEVDADERDGWDVPDVLGDVDADTVPDVPWPDAYECCCDSCGGHHYCMPHPAFELMCCGSDGVLLESVPAGCYWRSRCPDGTSSENCIG